ncbi:hypothetical protein BY996DRAFT_7688001 [Phakopsora pachyrhizi]|nr:hypothetical protein BY996DRAFT_7688001 [Phakopsora pachyrhizi]
MESDDRNNSNNHQTDQVQRRLDSLELDYYYSTIKKNESLDDSGVDEEKLKESDEIGESPSSSYSIESPQQQQQHQKHQNSNERNEETQTVKNNQNNRSLLRNKFNRSTPSLRTKDKVKILPPPIPTSDDLSLDRLRIVDNSFRPNINQSETDRKFQNLNDDSTKDSQNLDDDVKQFQRSLDLNSDKFNHTNHQMIDDSIDSLLENLINQQSSDSDPSLISPYYQQQPNHNNPLQQQSQSQSDLTSSSSSSSSPSSSSSKHSSIKPHQSIRSEPVPGSVPGSEPEPEPEHEHDHGPEPESDHEPVPGSEPDLESDRHLPNQCLPDQTDYQLTDEQELINHHLTDSTTPISTHDHPIQSQPYNQHQQQPQLFQHHHNKSVSSLGSSYSYAHSINSTTNPQPRLGIPSGPAANLQHQLHQLQHPQNSAYPSQYYQSRAFTSHHPHYHHPSQINGLPCQQQSYGLNYGLGHPGYVDQYPIGGGISQSALSHSHGRTTGGMAIHQQPQNNQFIHPNSSIQSQQQQQQQQQPSQLRLTSQRPGTSLSVLSNSSASSVAPSLLSQNTNMRSSTSSVPKPGPTISKASIDEYRNRIKSDPDPEAHFNYAKFLIEAAKKLASGGAAGDDKAIKKYRDNLLQESLKLIKRLATQGVGLGKPAYSEAQFFLANCLGNGSLGLQVDHEKAYNLYVQASKQNHGAASYRTAVCNELGAGTRKDFNRAMLFYRKASALGDTAGMYKLGMILLNGTLGQAKNPQEALLWLKRAAQQADEDNPHSLHELAQLYENPPLITPPPKPNQKSQPQPIGYLVPKDEAYSRELYTQAAQLGYPPSQNRLGACYEYGALSCPIDPMRSIGWYTKAAQKGDPESELALSGWYLTGSGNVLRQSDEEAYLWARRAASKGLAKAEYAVGYYSEVGIGVKADLEEAKRWYMRAATNKNKRAMQRLTELKKIGNQKPGKKQARPTRDEAASECIVN